jgi:iron complex transport system substrate-binding protein
LSARHLVAVLLLLAATPAAAAPGSAPSRVVSLNPCLDVTLVAVADRGQIAALSHYSRDPASSIPEIAKTLPYTNETAEEVILARPDLVLTSRHSGLATRNALRRAGIATELFDVPVTVDQSIAQVRRMAGLVGHPEKGEALAAEIEAALAAAAPPPGAKPVTALVFQRNGFTPGSGELTDELLTRTGFVNVAARYGAHWGYMPLERVLADPPQIMLAGEVTPGMPSWADRVLRHPALASLASRMKKATLPDRLFQCGGPVIIAAVRALSAARALALKAAP